MRPRLGLAPYGEEPVICPLARVRRTGYCIDRVDSSARYIYVIRSPVLVPENAYPIPGVRATGIPPVRLRGISGFLQYEPTVTLHSRQGHRCNPVA